MFGHLHSKIPLSKMDFLTPFERGVSEGLQNWMKLDDVGCTFKHEFGGKAFYCRASFHCFCAF